MYIKIYNVFTQFNHEQKLHVNELYFYSQLATLQTHENKVYINNDLLAQLIIFNSKKSQNIKKIKELLQSLKQKQIIQFNDTKNNNELMIISFCTIEGGYEPISYEKFRSFSDVYDYYIYVCVARTKENMVEFSLSQWGTLLELSRPQTISKLKRVIDKGIICKREGKYTDEEVRKNQKKQEKNIYYLPSAKEKIEQKEKDVTETSATSSKENVKTVQENNTTNTNNEQEQREHNWYVKGSQLTANDFYIYLTTNDEKLKKQAEARINAISKNEKGKYIVESLMREAQEKVKDEKRKAEREMLKQMTNAVRLKDGTIVAVDENNIDSIDVNDVEHIFYSYHGQHLEGCGEIKGFQTGKLINNKFVYDDRPDMIERGWELYVEHVKTGEMLTGDKMRSIRDTVVNEFFPTQKDETVKVVAKKVENEYVKMAERAKREAEQKRKREIIDIAAIVVEDWELD
ncbi:hypothetical protein [Anoxybacillus flavithermus]|uniref:hypothetical protein n=1 Tax=Anoxybacillus flavithermus TaxID=33934 RepID=UPI000B4A460A|nr:hypothetical protein [Anoxybacillus flavithermus]ASA96511.1 hypothetical protein CA592_06525 [Anoxybacillus flavithermus]